MPDTTPAWAIVAQREDMQLGPSGGFVPGMVVTFRTRAGVTSSVFVPSTDYTVDKVRAAIDAQAATIDAVHALTGPSEA